MRDAGVALSGLDAFGEPTVEYTVGPGEPLSGAVVRAAEAAGVDPDGGGAVLGDVVYGDALNRLFTDPDAGFVVFELWEQVFVVRSDEVCVYDRSDA